MTRVARIKRSVLVCTLILSVTGVGFVARPAIAETGMTSATAAASQPKRTCCCGTPDGKCCGMGCCASQAPKNIPLETPARLSGSERELIQLALQPLALAVRMSSLGFRADGTIFSDSTLAVPSLQVQHVRIQT